VTPSTGESDHRVGGTVVDGMGGQPKIVLRSADGATAEIYRHGAHLTSWRPALDGEERIFLSRRSAWHDGSAIRGGIPVIFPQFAAEGPLPKHGFVRTRSWTMMSLQSASGGDAAVSFQLRDSVETRAIWPFAFLATLVVRLGGRRLTVSLTVENTGDESFSFTAALHSYLRVRDVTDVRLDGVQGASYRESGAPGLLHREEREALTVEGSVDRVYVSAPPLLTLREPGRALDIESVGFTDAVVWNPGAAGAAALPDMEPAGERVMLCVEAAVVQHPVVLEPGARWSGSQSLAARD
jgi:glucose-6-phosphate 1-epimerase